MRNVFKLAGVMCCAALIVMACSISGTQPGSGSALSRAVTTDALNKGIQFYQYNYCGTGQTASWRGDCHMQDEVVGGYHDAGDHVKFQLPAAFTAALLCWADYEYGLDVGSVITRFNNYFMQLGTTNFLYQIGDPGADHAYWGPPELQTGTRPSYKTSQGSCVMAGTAAALAAGIVGVCIGFLPWNSPPARIFMGDTGATLIGFTLGAVALVGAGKNVALVSLLVPMLALAVPIVDAIRVVLRRSWRGVRIFEADREHIHHFLLSLGLGTRRTLLLLYLVTALSGGVALFLAAAPRFVFLFIGLLALGCFALMFRRGPDRH